MIRTLTLAKDDGTIIKKITEELQTEKNWNKRLYKLRRNAKGETFMWSVPVGRTPAEAKFFSDKEVIPMTEREIERYRKHEKEKRKEARNRAKAKKEEELEEEREYHRMIMEPIVSKVGNIIVLDTETTGLSGLDEILQLAIIDGQGGILMNELFRPKTIRVWPEAQAIHGISPEAVAEKPTIEDRKEEIQKIIDSADKIVGYNVTFDINKLRRHGITVPKNVIVADLMEPFAEVYGEWNEYFGNYKWQKLETCAAYYGYDWEGASAHDALSDCRATLHCFKRMSSLEQRNILKLKKEKKHE